MPENLVIEIEADDSQSIASLLKHIFGEVTEDKKYKDTGIECQAKSHDGWMEVITNKTKGKYRWTKRWDTWN